MRFQTQISLSMLEQETYSPIINSFAPISQRTAASIANSLAQTFLANNLQLSRQDQHFYQGLFGSASDAYGNPIPHFVHDVGGGQTRLHTASGL